MRRILCAGMIFIFLLLGGCELEDPSLNESGSMQSHANAPIRDTVFGVAYTSEDRMNPLATKNKTNLELYSLVYEGLFELDENFEPVNLLCKDYQISGNTYRFELKEGVKFSDGSLLRASDVAHSLRLAMQPNSYYASRLTNIASVTYEGNSTVVVTVKRNTANLPRLLDVPIIKSGSEASEIAIGTGAYAITSNGHGVYYLSTHEDWHPGKKLPYSRIELRKVSSIDELIFGFDSRDIDVLTVDSTSSDPMQFRSQYVSNSYPTTTFQYIGFNLSKPSLANTLVRQAIACSIDREATASQDFAQLADATTLPIHPNSPAYDSISAEALSYSPEKALSLLSSAGFADTDNDGRLENKSGGELSFRLLVTSENKSRVALAHRIKNDLAKIGVTVTVVEKSWADYNSALSSGNFDAYIAEVNLTADFDISRLIRTSGALNFGRYSSASTDACLDAFNSSTLRKSEQALAYYNNFISQVPIAPILFKKNTHMTHTDAFSYISFTQRNVFYHFYDWKPVK